MSLILVSFLMIALMTPLTVTSVEGSSNDDTEEGWKTVHTVGEFLYNEPPKPDQIFKIQYRVVNGTIEEFIASQYGVAAQVDSNDNATLEINFPRNFPYTNDGEGTDPIFFINGLEVFPPEKSITDCFFAYSIPYIGNSKIELALTYLATNLPYHGDDVPDSCISETVVEDLSTISPLQQFKAGVAAEDIACKEGFELILHPNGKPYCATPSTVERLEELWNL